MGFLNWLLLFFAMHTVRAIPSTRCFAGGQKMHELTSSKVTSEACLKDDVSQVKIHTNYFKNETGIYAIMTAYRKWTVADWHECRPKKTVSGSINVIEVDKSMMISSVVYTCDKDCTINIDKENAQIILHTEGINNFEVSGTTVIKAWFKTTATIPLQQTCEHIKIICGKKILQFHSCFKHHMSCIRYLQNSMVPGKISNAICQNLELLIMTTITTLIFSILILLAKTYLCYLLLPLFIPIAYCYGFFYDRSCKKCKSCGLAYHPFTKCGEHCVCGGKFETSERMKIHRDSGLCQGYKSLRSARVLCKSKASALTLSVLLSILLLGFLTPVQGVPIKTNFTIDELPEYSQDQSNQVTLLHKNVIYSLLVDLLLIILVFVSIICINHFVYSIANIFAIYCNTCDMYHSRSNLKYFGDFTNRCGSCTCGQFEDMQGVLIHKRSSRCLTKYKIMTLKHVILWIIITLVVKDFAMVAQAKTLKECLQIKELEKDCTGPFFDIKECSTTTMQKSYGDIANWLKTKEVISELDKKAASELSQDVTRSLQKIETTLGLHQKILFEILFLSRNCDYYKSFDNVYSTHQLQWQTLAKNGDFDYCKTKGTEALCKCISGAACQSIIDKKDDIDTHYKSKDQQRKKDIETVMSITRYMFPGTGHSYIANQTVTKQYTKVVEYFTSFAEKHATNLRLKAFSILISGLLKTTTSLEPPEQLASFVPKLARPTIPGFTDLIDSNFDQSAQNDGRRCKSPSVIVCASPRTGYTSDEMYICRDTKYYIIDTKGLQLYKLDNSAGTYCVGDKYCNLKYRVLTPEESLALRKDNNCKHKEYTEPKNYLTERLTICRQKATGKCGEEPTFRVSLCENGFVYPTAAKASPKDSAFPNDRCFDTTCKYGYYPYNMIQYSKCVWDNIKITSSRIKIASYENFQEYKDQLLKKITSDLTIGKFNLVENMPYFIPKRKYLTIKGVTTADGIDGSFVEFEIPSLTGVSAGYTVTTKEGQELFDFIVYIKNSATSATYSYAYSTGPTIGINNKHTEVCTGKCPEKIPHEAGWATFSRERTSTWGCEEFGCLAINEGCLYGSCQDVVKPELDIYSKAGADTTKTNVCISLNHKTYCQEIDALNPIITENIEAQFKTVESKNLPRLIAIKNHKLYTGQINELGSFGKYCGNLQVTNNQTLGLADVKFDYTCHAAQRKDILIRKCLENSYQSCKLLKEESDYMLIEEATHVTISDNKKINGNLAIKAIFGDFNYKSYTKDLDFEAEISCVGCFSCLHGIVCEANLKTTVETSCEVTSICSLYTNRLILLPSQEKYSLMIRCDRQIAENELDISICGKKIESHITITNTNDKLELSTGEQSTYIHEEDLRCTTWLCKFQEEGFNFILGPIYNWLGKFTWPVIAIIIIIFLIFIGVYVFMPMCMKLRDILKKNEYEHLQEIKTDMNNIPMIVKYKIKPFA
ncbi:polyprotein [Witwatersrand virus]|uniref:Envelopment polyprotein n=1 Tax=Witwatersrand virus TaxID=1678231 RepID=A0A0R7FK55_9VIRU|nr:polyprotein [Witwatersrand virus]AKO90183.1 polyprotein [Witwatersrand virus]